MRCFRVVSFALFAVVLTACASPRLPSPDYAGIFADRFAAEFDSPESAKEAWLEYGGQAVRKVQERVYPTVSYEDFSSRAIARIREFQANYPDSSVEALSFVALDGFHNPLWMARQERTAVFHYVEAISDGDACGTWSVSIVAKARPCPPYAHHEGTNYKEPDETGLGIAVLSIPLLGQSLYHSEMPHDLAEQLQMHDGPIILDLRGNRGGLLTTIPRVADFFLHEKTLVFANKTHERTIRYSTQATQRSEPIGPVLVLIDKNTNSGAIAIAAALQDHGVGHISGAATQPIKAVIETVIPFDNCPPGIEECFINFPAGHIVRPSGANLDEDLKIDFPIDPDNEDALIRVLKIWSGEAEIAATR